jgi:hypothetical protein
MPNPTAREGHVDALLSNISVAYMQSADNFIADKVFPIVPVKKASDFYLEFPRGYFFRDNVGPRPMGGVPNIAGYKLDKGTYFCEEQALEATLDDRERANATPPYDPEKSKVRFLTQQHLIHRDRDWANKFFKTGIWNHEWEGKSADPNASSKEFLQFNDSKSDPISFIDQRKEEIAESTGYEPNVLTLGRAVFRALKNHPLVRERIQYTQRGIITNQLLAELFEVDRVVVPGGVYNAAVEGDDDDFEFIVSKKDALLAYAAPAPGIDVPSAGYIFSWTGLLGDAALESGVWRGRDDRAHSDWFQVRMAYDMKKVAADLGLFLKNAVADGV